MDEPGPSADAQQEKVFENDVFVLERRKSGERFVPVITFKPSMENVRYEHVMELMEEIQFAITKLQNEAGSSHCVDMSEVQYCSSAGLTLLLNYWKNVHQRGGSQVMYGLTPKVTNLFELTSLDKMWPIYDRQQITLEELLKVLASSK